MAEGKPRKPEAGAQLEELNDQLARFLQHADQLLDDWARFGAQVRATVEQEAARIEQGVAEAGERATRQLGGQVDKLATERVERAIGDGLKRLKAELDRAGRATAVAAPAPASIDRRLLGGVVIANVLLVILLAVTLLRGGGQAAAPVASVVDAGPAAPSADVIEACRALLGGWSDEAAAIVVRVGTLACGDDASAVADTLRAHLTAPPPMDAGVDAAPMDAKPAKRGAPH